MAEPVRFQPRFTLTIVYFFGFLVAYGLLMASPEIVEGLRSLPADADPTEAGRETVRQALRGRMPLAALAALVTVGGLTWLRILPGMGGPEGRRPGG